MALPRAFSLQDASLLSGIEPLPLSSPPSPHRSFPDLSSSSPPLYPAASSSLRRAASSQVTTQLYASLRRSREGEAEPAHPAPAEHQTQPSVMASEIKGLAEEMSHNLQEGLEGPGRTEASTCISQMEALRGHLKTMLTPGDMMAIHGGATDLEHHSDCTSALLGARPMQDLSPPLSLTGLEGLFPRYSTLYNSAPTLPDLQLRDALEKETARRKHLERHIQNLQNEMLELQQRLSVALTADRRKDAMIQQLDQTLAMVVGGWKQQEQQKEELIHHLRQEKDEAQHARSIEQEALNQVQQELAEVLESLEREKRAADEQQIELQRQVDEQTARVSTLQAQLEAKEESQAVQCRELETLHHRIQEQQKTWEQREKELQEECERVQEEGTRELEKEKALTQQEIQRSQQLQLALSSLQSDAAHLERDLQTLQRERDSLQMELNLEKARNESEKVRIESEHKMRLEEEITRRLAAVHEESAQHMSSAREQHRRQLLEITSQHEAELSSQLAQFKSELQERERRHREAIMDYELKLSCSEERSQQLSRSLRRLETERAEMLTQLQDVMKSHWSQALRVLSAKAPTDVPSPLAPAKQGESTEQWSTKLVRMGSYGEESSAQAKQVEEGDSHLASSTREPSESTLTSSTAPGHLQVNRSNESGGTHAKLSSQQMEDINRASQRSTSSRQSVNSINVSQLLNEKVLGEFQEPIARYIDKGQGSKSSVDDIPGSHSLLGVGQGDHVNFGSLHQPSKPDRGLFNRSGSDLRRQIQLQRSEQQQGLLEIQSLMSGNLNFIQREFNSLNLISSGPSQPIPFHHPSFVKGQQNLASSDPSMVGHTSYTGKSQVSDDHLHSFSHGHSQTPVAIDPSNGHCHPKDATNWATGKSQASDGHLHSFSHGHSQSAIAVDPTVSHRHPKDATDRTAGKSQAIDDHLHSFSHGHSLASIAVDPSDGHRHPKDAIDRTTGKSEASDVNLHSFSHGQSQSAITMDPTISHRHPKDASDRTTTEPSHLEEIRRFIAQMGHPASAGLFSSSATSKNSIQGLNKEIKIHTVYSEEPTMGQRSHKMAEPEESFYPMQMEDLSHSFGSHQGFFALEPHLDATVMERASTSLPQTSPEHPFQEDRLLQAAEWPPNWEADPDRTSANPLLQYYIRMLLDRTPGEPLNELEKEVSRVNPDVTELHQYLQSKENQPPFRSEVKPPASVSKPHTKKQTENKAPEVVKKEVLSAQRRPNVSKPLKRVSARGGRSGIWK